MALTKVKTGGITDATIATDNIADGAITTTKIPDNAIVSGKILDQAVTLAKLPHGDGSSDGKFLRANNGGDPTFENVPAGGISNLVEDTSPQLGGALDTNGNNVNFLDNNLLRLGTGNDLVIYHDGSNSFISEQGTGSLQLNSNGADIELKTDNSETMAKFRNNGAAELYYDNSKKFESTSSGVEVFGELQMDDANSHIKLPDNARIDLGTGADAYMYFDGTDMNIRGTANVQNVNIWTENVKKYQFTDGALRPLSDNSFDLGNASLRWRNIYTGDLHLSNKGSSNDVDSTWGDWTIQEGESDLFLKNNRSGKKYKFNLTEVS